MRLCLIAFLAAISTGWVQALGAVDTAPATGLEKADRLAREGQVDRALAAYRELSGSQPASARVHARTGGMLLLKQEYAEAIRSFQIAIGLDAENNAEAFIGLGIAYLHLGQYGAARAALTEARRLKPESGSDIDQLLAWLDGRSPGPQADHR